MDRRSIAVVAAMATVFALSSAASASPDAEAASVGLVNAARASNGLPPLSVSADLVAVARRHAERMAVADAIWHNPSLQHEVSGWRVVGENVGRGSSVEAIHEALMASPTHRANVLWSAPTQIGVGVATGSDGRLYVTQVFREPFDTASAPTRGSTAAAKLEPASAAVEVHTRAVTLLHAVVSLG